MGYRKTTPELVAKWVAAYAEGKTIGAIAKEDGYAAATVQARLVKQGIALRGMPDDETIAKTCAESKNLFQVAAKLGVNFKVLRNHVKQRNIELPKLFGLRRYTHNADFFASYTPESCYFAGLLAADGCLMERKGSKLVKIGLQIRDIEIIKSFTKLSGTTNPITIIECSKKHPTHTDLAHLSVCSRQWFDDLFRNFSLTPRKSLTLQPPPAHMPHDMRLHFIRGVFDGDGTASQAPRQIAIASGSPPFLEWIKEALGSHHEVSHRKDTNVYVLSVAGPTLRRVAMDLYKNSTPDTRLARKYEKMLPLILGEYDPIGDLQRELTKDDAKISEMYSSGASLAKVGEEFDRSSCGVVGALNRSGTKTRSIQEAGVTFRSLDSLQESEIVSKYQENRKTAYELADEYGISRVAVTNLLRRHGVKLRNAGNYAPQISPELAKQATEAYARGETLPSLAKWLGISFYKLKAILIANGATFRPRGVSNKKLSEEQCANIVEEYKSGVGQSILGRKYGVAGSSIIRMLRKRGIAIRNPGVTKELTSSGPVA